MQRDVMFKRVKFSPSDPLRTEPPSRARPKLGSFDASRPGLFGPRPFQRDPFQRERRSSDGASCTSEEDRHSQASSTGSCGETEARPPPAQASSAPRERIIPIRIEGDNEGEEKPMDPPPQRPLRKHERRDTVDGADVDRSGKGRDDVEARDARAQSCPVTSQPPGSTSVKNSGSKFAPLRVNEALASQQREAQAPGGRASYQNVSPKPFSPGSRPFKSSSFGMFGSPTTTAESPLGRSSEPPRPPPIPPKPSAAEIRAARQQQNTTVQQHQHQQQQQQQQQQQSQQSSDQQKPQQPMSAKDEALSKITAIQTDLDPLTHRLEAFDGARGDKEYLYLDEMLTRGLLKLDGLDTGGDAEVRSARKEAVRRIEKSLSDLERRAAEGAKDAAKSAAGDVQKSASVVLVNGVKMDDGEVDRRATSAPPQGLARAEPVVIGGDAAEEEEKKRRASAEEMGRG